MRKPSDQHDALSLLRWNCRERASERGSVVRKSPHALRTIIERASEEKAHLHLILNEEVKVSRRRLVANLLKLETNGGKFLLNHRAGRGEMLTKPSWLAVAHGDRHWARISHCGRLLFAEVGACEGGTEGAEEGVWEKSFGMHTRRQVGTYLHVISLL